MNLTKQHGVWKVVFQTAAGQRKTVSTRCTNEADARKVVAESGLKDLRWHKHFRAMIPYSLLAPLEKFSDQEGFEIVSREFLEYVTLEFQVPSEREAEFQTFFSNLVSFFKEYFVLYNNLL